MSQGLVLGPFFLIYILSLGDPVYSCGSKYYPYVDNSQSSPNLRTSVSFWKLKDLSPNLCPTPYSVPLFGCLIHVSNKKCLNWTSSLKCKEQYMVFYCPFILLLAIISILLHLDPRGLKELLFIIT